MPKYLYCPECDTFPDSVYSIELRKIRRDLMDLGGGEEFGCYEFIEDSCIIDDPGRKSDEELDEWECCICGEHLIWKEAPEGIGQHEAV